MTATNRAVARILAGGSQGATHEIRSEAHRGPSGDYTLVITQLEICGEPYTGLGSGTDWIRLRVDASGQVFARIVDGQSLHCEDDELHVGVRSGSFITVAFEYLLVPSPCGDPCQIGLSLRGSLEFGGDGYVGQIETTRLIGPECSSSCPGTRCPDGEPLTEIDRWTGVRCEACFPCD